MSHNGASRLEERLIQETARRFAREELQPRAAQLFLAVREAVEP